MEIFIISIICFSAGYYLARLDFTKNLINLNLRLKDLEEKNKKLSNKLYELLNNN